VTFVGIVLGPVLVISGFGLYIITNIFLGRFRRMPWEFIALSTIGGLVSAGLALARPSPSTVVAAFVTEGLLAFLYWFFFSFSMYGPREDRPRVGARSRRSACLPPTGRSTTRPPAGESVAC